MVGGLELIRELMATARPPTVPSTPTPAPTPTPRQGLGPPASARSAAIHHLDPWRALTADPAALTRLTKQFATSHLLDRLLARPPLKEPSPPAPPHHRPPPKPGSYLLCPLPPTGYCPSPPRDALAYCWPSLTTPKYFPPHTQFAAHAFLPLSTRVVSCSSPSL